MKQEKVFEKLRQALRSRKRRMLWQRMVSILACVSVFLTTYALILPAVTMDVDEYAECGMVHHVHTDACYAQKWVPEERTLICTQSEGDPYGSAADTTAWDIYAAEPDTTPAGHTHTDACYEITPGYWERGELICPLPEHEHDMNCFAGGSRLEDEFAFCPVGYQHTHSEECYVDDVLVCSLTEHIHTDDCRPMEEATIESAPASDGAVAVISGMMPRGASATIEAVEMSYEDMVQYFGERRAAAMRSFVAYDIKIMVNGAEWQPNETVSVTVRQPAIEVAEDEALAVAHVDGATQEVSDVEVALDESGEVCFETDGFSIFIFYTFTVDFHYGDVTFSITGYDDILLSDLFAALGLEFDLAEIADVYFSDPTLLDVEALDGDWLLTSLAPFDTDETLTLLFADGTTFDIWVTDADDADQETEEPEEKVTTRRDGVLSDPQSGSDSYAQWWSDPDTSHLEDNTSGISAAFNRENGGGSIAGEMRAADDGKVLTDKTVVYKGDSYYAFEDYEDYEFSVTLSALAQEYYLTSSHVLRAPLDVILVIDCSGSMTGHKVDVSDTDHRQITRLEAAINSANETIDAIMKNNEANRVGVVIFSANSAELLPLDRYYEANGKYLTTGTATVQGGENKTVLQTSSTLRQTDQNGSRITPTNGISTVMSIEKNQQGLGTNIQRGIAQAEDMFEKAAENNGSVYQETWHDHQYNFFRQPVYILLSDGMPTYGTDEYDKALTTTTWYGNGVENENTYPFGYYTILTSQWAKSETTKHYYQATEQGVLGADGKTIFCTIGFGVTEPYTKTVLNPNKSNIKNLNVSGSNGSNDNEIARSNGLYELLTAPTGSEKTVSYTKDRDNPKYWVIKNINTESRIPVIKNDGLIPLQGNAPDGKGYADSAFAGKLTAEDLQNVFQRILKQNLRVKDYGFVLAEDTYLEFADQLGEGMEVHGDTMVLRYDGDQTGASNYTLVAGEPEEQTDGTIITPYEFTGGQLVHTVKQGEMEYVVFLDKVKVWVEEKDGVQTVRFQVPEEAVPVYSPSFTSSYEWYYQTLPIRLIYKVGLNETLQAQAEAKTLSGTFFTNDQTNPAFSTFTPADDNPYYFNVNYTPDQQHAGHPASTAPLYDGDELSLAKAPNTTDTIAYAWDYMPKENVTTDSPITNTLGNNGKLVFEKLPTLELIKQDKTSGTQLSGAKFTLSDGSTTEEAISDKDGAVAFTQKLKYDTEYTLTETVAPDGYNKLPDVFKFKVTKVDEILTVTVTGTGLDSSFYSYEEQEYGGELKDGVLTVTLKDTSSAALPSTGGSGMKPFVSIGLGLMAGSLTIGIILRRRRERRQAH